MKRLLFGRKLVLVCYFAIPPSFLDVLRGKFLNICEIYIYIASISGDYKLGMKIIVMLCRTKGYKKYVQLLAYGQIWF